MLPNKIPPNISDFEEVFQDVVDLIVNCPEHEDIRETNKWMKKVFNFNVPNGKKIRGLLCVTAYYELAGILDEEEIYLSQVLAWCIEILQASFLIADDIMDHSETRRGQPCWYKTNSLGPAAFNDSIILENAVYHVIQEKFKEKPYYGQIVDIFRDVTFKTALGQSLDTLTALNLQIETFTMEKYSSIVKYKTSYYTFYLPIFLAMAMAGVKDEEVKKISKEILLKIGHLFQVQDDFLDVYGDEKLTGKVGSDIQDGKCSWLIVKALEMANEKQRKSLVKYYGQGMENTKAIDEIKKIFDEMNISALYQNFENETFAEVRIMIESLPHDFPTKVFNKTIQLIHKRNK